MFKIKDIETNEEIILYLKEYKEVQKKYSDTENICYTKISLYLAIKNNLFFNNFLFHPCVLDIKPFYEEKIYVDEEGLINLIASVLEYELTNDEVFLTQKELKKLIKIHTKLVKKKEKKESK